MVVISWWVFVLLNAVLVLVSHYNHCQKFRWAIVAYFALLGYHSSNIVLWIIICVLCVVMGPVASNMGLAVKVIMLQQDNLRCRVEWGAKLLLRGVWAWVSPEHWWAEHHYIASFTKIHNVGFEIWRSGLMISCVHDGCSEQRRSSSHKSLFGVLNVFAQTVHYVYVIYIFNHHD